MLNLSVTTIEWADFSHCSMFILIIKVFNNLLLFIQSLILFCLLRKLWAFSMFRDVCIVWFSCDCISLFTCTANRFNTCFTSICISSFFPPLVSSNCRSPTLWLPTPIQTRRNPQHLVHSVAVLLALCGWFISSELFRYKLYKHECDVNNNNTCNVKTNYIQCCLSREVESLRELGVS